MKFLTPSATILTDIHPEFWMNKLEIYARTCYQSFEKVGPGTADKLLRHCISRGHESVIEHLSVTVRIICDRGISHELVRHRIASFSQESTRYVKYDDIEVIEPSNLDEPGKALWRAGMKFSAEAYRLLLEAGTKPEIARSVLPNSLKTELIMTANLREWRHILKLRCSNAAHVDMRKIMIPLLQEFKKKLPVIFEDIEEGKLS